MKQPIISTITAIVLAGMGALNQQPSMAGDIAQNNSISSQCPAFVPRVNPWRLEKPILLGNNSKSAYFYKRVVLAGNAEMVGAFLRCYDLHIKGHPNYASGLYKLWAACKELANPANPSDAQMVCVAMDDDARALDDRIFDEGYAHRVTQKIFR